MAWSRGLPLRFYFTCGLLRVVLGKLSGRQIQFLLPRSVDIYKRWVKQKRIVLEHGKDMAALEKLKERIDTLPDMSSSVMWLGDPSKADKVVLFFHGGGFKAPMSPGHLEWCLQAYVYANPTMNIAVAVLQYSLAPHATFPVQLSQAASAFVHLLSHYGFTPKNIVIGGDSAGGNLTSQLLGHLLHPHPEVKSVQIDEPLLGAFLVSPLLSASTTTSSFKENDGIDMLSAYSATLAVSDALESTDHKSKGQVREGWATPVDVDESWLDELSGICRNLYITVGQQEVLRDQGVLFADIVRRRNPDLETRLEISWNEAHDFILLEGASEVVGDATTRMRNWFKSLVS